MAFNIHKALYDGLIQRGIAPEAAKGAVASMMGEGGHKLDTSSRNPGDGRDGSDSIGFGQWNGSRAIALKNTAAKMGLDWRDPRVQVQHVFNELETTERRAINQLKAARTANDGVRGWTTSYERPADKVGESVNRRQNLAAADQYISGNGDTTMPTTAQRAPAAPTVAVNDYAFSNAKQMARPTGLLSDAPMKYTAPDQAPAVVAQAEPAAPKEQVAAAQQQPETPIDVAAYAAPRMAMAPSPAFNQPAPTPQRVAAATPAPQGLLGRLANEFLISSAQADEAPPQPSVTTGFTAPRLGASAPASIVPSTPPAIVPPTPQPPKPPEESPPAKVALPEEPAVEEPKATTVSFQQALGQQPSDASMYAFGRLRSEAAPQGLLAQGPQMPAGTNPGSSLAPGFIQNPTFTESTPLSDTPGGAAAASTDAAAKTAPVDDEKAKWLKAIAGVTDAGNIFASGMKKGTPLNGIGTSAQYHLPTVPLTQLRPNTFQGGQRFKGLLG